MTESPPGAAHLRPLPIYVDLDGTLIHSDLLWESLLSGVRQRPLAALAGVTRLAGGRAAMKQALADAGSVDVAALPFNGPFVDWLRARAAEGHPVWMATAADRALAEQVAAHLGLFQGVLASDGRHNLKGAAKLAAIRAHAGEQDFIYCGNGPEDVQIFAQAAQAVVVGASAGVRAEATAQGRVLAEFIGAGPGGARAWLRALRPHQWLKNLLVFVPLLTAFRVADPGAGLAAFLAFVAFCLVASGGYLVNDLLDLASDRRHPTKYRRPFASGELFPGGGVFAAIGLFIGGLVLAMLLAPTLAGWLAAYALLTLFYSMVVKRQAVFDLIALAALYTIRILAGGAAIGVEVSFWLLAFSVFLFFSLAAVKRCAELESMRVREVGKAHGRGYRAEDMEVLRALGTATSMAAVLVLALYVESAVALHRYAAPRLLWLMLVALLAWLSHLWLTTSRGEMHDDPLVFALRDRVSRWLLAAMGLAYGSAALLH